MTSTVLEARRITKAFGRKGVIKGLDLRLEKGDRYVLFGANGAGKTTLVKLLSTVMPPDSGEVRLFGRKVDASSRATRARIGFLSHDPYLYGELTAMENLMFYSKLYSISGSRERIKDLLSRVGLYHRAYDRVSSFSRGMKQRLGLARALLHDPALIFLDEPYAGLDLGAKETLNGLITDMNEDGKTFFLITHDLANGLQIGRRCGILHEGIIEHEGRCSESQAFRDRYVELTGGSVC